jgi:exonuclease III
MSLRGRWYNIIVLHVHAPTGSKTVDMEDTFYEELERIHDQIRKYHGKILFGDFNAKVSREDIFKPTIGNQSLHEINNDNGVRIVNLTHKKICQEYNVST